MTYAQFVKRMREFKRNIAPAMPALTTGSDAARMTGLSSAKARAYLDRMAREGKAVREQPWRRIFYTIGDVA